MLFNSLSFAVFLPIIFALYWLFDRKKLVYQNILLLTASYYFYGCWDWRFLFLLAFSTFLDYYSGLQIFRSTTSARRKMWLVTSVVINLSFLGFFKNYNFFIDSFSILFHRFGYSTRFSTLQIILPVGISFTHSMGFLTYLNFIIKK